MQKRNSALVENLKADFWHQNDPLLWRARAWAASLGWPGQRGFFPGLNNNQMNPFAYLSFNGTPLWKTNGLMAYVELDGTEHQWGGTPNTSFWQVFGNETWTTTPGFTVASWVRRSGAYSGPEGILSHWNANTSNRSWRMFYYDVNDVFRLDVSTSGTGVSGGVAESNHNPVGDTWYFVVGRWSPGTSLEIWTLSDGVEDRVINTTSIASAPLHNAGGGGVSMKWGAYKDSAGADQEWTGNVAWGLMSAAYVPDYLIDAVYYATYPFFFEFGGW